MHLNEVTEGAGRRHEGQREALVAAVPRRGGSLAVRLSLCPPYPRGGRGGGARKGGGSNPNSWIIHTFSCQVWIRRALESTPAKLALHQSSALDANPNAMSSPFRAPGAGCGPGPGFIRVLGLSRSCMHPGPKYTGSRVHPGSRLYEREHAKHH